MAEDGFNKEDLLSIGDLLKDRLRVVNEAVKKLNYFVEKNFAKPGEIYYMPENSFYVMCRVYPPLELYFRMYQTGRPLTNGEVVALGEFYKIGKEATVQRYLVYLRKHGFIKRLENGKYQAIPPDRLGLTDIV
ncbi:hypothetical protein ES703_45905 [subsurface metagenome]